MKIITTRQEKKNSQKDVIVSDPRAVVRMLDMYATTLEDKLDDPHVREQYFKILVEAKKIADQIENY